MQFKLLKYGLKLIPALTSLSIGLVSSNSVEAVTPFVGYRGTALGLTGVSLSALALRSDGRYLFYGSGNAFNSLDALGFERTGTAAAAQDSILAIAMISDTSAQVATISGLETFDVSKALAPKSSGTPRTISLSSGSVVDACIDSSKTAFYLVNSSPFTVKTLDLSGTTSDVAMASHSSDDSPFAIRCSTAGPIVFANNSVGRTQTLQLYGTANAFDFNTILGNIPSGYSRGDFEITQDGTKIVVLYNRASTSSASDGKAVIVSASGLSVAAIREDLGTNLRAALSFYDESTLSQGYFAELDYGSGGSPVSEKFISTTLADFTTSSAVSLFNRSKGTSGAGNSASLPTQSLSTTVDYYTYMITEATGLSLISKAPSIPFTTDPSNQTLTGTNPLSISIGPVDSDLIYEVRYSDEPDSEGETGGINPAVGNSIIAATTISSGNSATISLSASQLGITEQGLRSVYIFATDPGASSAPKARAGVRFNYDPPPGAVRNINLRYGDQSVHVFFDGPADKDISRYYVFFSYNASSLETLDYGSETTVVGYNGRTLTSPMQVDASGFEGEAVIAPLQNGNQLYVRIMAMDNSGQITPAADIPAAQGKTPYATKALTDAFGGSSSCSLSEDGRSGFAISLWSLLLAVALATLRRAKRV